MKRIVHKINALTSTEIPVTPETLNPTPPPSRVAGCIFPRLQSAIMIIRARAVNSNTLIQSIQSMLIALTDSPLSFSFCYFLLLSQTVRSTCLSVLYETTVLLHYIWHSLIFSRKIYVFFWTRYLASVDELFLLLIINSHYLWVFGYKLTLLLSIRLQTHSTSKYLAT